MPDCVSGSETPVFGWWHWRELQIDSRIRPLIVSVIAGVPIREDYRVNGRSTESFG